MGSILGLAKWVNDPALLQATTKVVDHRGTSKLLLPWLWHRPAAAAAIQPLAQELPYVTGGTVNRKKKKKTYTTCENALVTLLYVANEKPLLLSFI